MSSHLDRLLAPAPKAEPKLVQVCGRLMPHVHERIKGLIRLHGVEMGDFVVAAILDATERLESVPVKTEPAAQ